MKKIFLAAGLILAAKTAPAQELSNVGCVDPLIRQQSQEQKQIFIKQQFTVDRDAMVGMRGMEPYPVITTLKKGVAYQIIFIGNAKAKLSVEIFNGDDKQIAEKKETLISETMRMISFSFTPDETGSFLFVLNQKTRPKELCGSFTILEQKKNTADAPKQ